MNIKTQPSRHGHYIKRKASPTYSSWCAMKKRCLYPNDKSFHEYGGSGIKICQRWFKFKNFLEDMGIRPNGKSIDRIDNNLGYFKENCKWSTDKEQALNKKSTKIITFNGQSLSISDWSRKLGMCRDSIGKRLKAGWPIEKALTKERYSHVKSK